MSEVKYYFNGGTEYNPDLYPNGQNSHSDHHNPK
jgi:hypothetical protein